MSVVKMVPLGHHITAHSETTTNVNSEVLLVTRIWVCVVIATT